MKRKIEADMVAWKEREGHKPLLVYGGRQEGKTYSVTEFARKAYSRFIYINFEKRPEKKSIFSGSLDARYLCKRIQEYEGVTLDKDSVIVLDEIGYCKNAFSSLKSFAEECVMDVIASGSMLGIVLDRTKDGRISPMGFVDAMEMFPMDFEEFLWAAGVSEKLIDELKTSILEQKKINEYLLDSLPAPLSF
ncbi:MAG: AAA family ATPase [Candidatus Methanomethylophilaceae archaeon]|nr:AAA family ATPase [Candidatus Methanomethylophilaceae archaeon]